MCKLRACALKSIPGLFSPPTQMKRPGDEAKAGLTPGLTLWLSQATPGDNWTVCTIQRSRAGIHTEERSGFGCRLWTLGYEYIYSYDNFSHVTSGCVNGALLWAKLGARNGLNLAQAKICCVNRPLITGDFGPVLDNLVRVTKTARTCITPVFLTPIKSSVSFGHRQQTISKPS